MEKAPEPKKRTGEKIMFNKGPPVFTSRKGGLDKNDFPDALKQGVVLEDKTTKPVAKSNFTFENTSAPLNKANDASIGHFGSMARERGEPRTEERPQISQINFSKGPPQFTKAKKKTEEMQVHEKQNYDFSKMNMSKAAAGGKREPAPEEGDKSGVQKQQQQEGTAKQWEPPQGRAGLPLDDDDGFTVVTATKNPKHTFTRAAPMARAQQAARPANRFEAAGPNDDDWETKE